jgi:arginase
VIVDLLLVPYDSAQRSVRMGAGPEALLAAGLDERIRSHGHDVRVRIIEPPSDSWRSEIRTAFDLAEAVANAVRTAREEGRFALILAGNCGVAWGAVAGIGAGAQVVWADAHGDFNTPETTTSGFLDGMGLATLTGRCWSAMAAEIPGFVAVRDENVWLVGARDLQAAEVEALARSGVHQVAASDVHGNGARELSAQMDSRAPLYLHIDLDVLDPAEGRANAFAAGGGVPLQPLIEFCTGLRAVKEPSVVTFASYDPAADSDRRVSAGVLQLVDALFRRER